MECVLLPANKAGPIEFARLVMEQAIRPKPEPIYHSVKKDPVWRNSYRLWRKTYSLVRSMNEVWRVLLALAVPLLIGGGTL